MALVPFTWNAECYSKRRWPSNEEYQLCVDSFKELLQHQLQHGHIPEELFDKLGFAVDIDIKGNPYNRDAGMSRESYQRAKCLSHKHQRRLRAERIKHSEDELQERQLEEHSKFEDIVNRNRSCESKLCSLMDIDDEDKENPNTSFGTVTLDQLSKCTTKQLIASFSVQLERVQCHMHHYHSTT